MSKSPAKRIATVPQTDQPVFRTLRDLVLPYQTALKVVHDEPTHFYANCAAPDAKGKPVFFAAVKVSGKKTLFHFMPVYDFPDLLKGISPDLKKQMQGKSCFNFTTLSPALVSELQTVVQQGAAAYKTAGKL